MKCWKDKILDYEIETEHIHRNIIAALLVEKIRFSITRLKPGAMCHQDRLRYNGWKDKILDYEIETENICQGCSPNRTVEKIRFSITRLKLRLTARCHVCPDKLKR